MHLEYAPHAAGFPVCRENDIKYYLIIIIIISQIIIWIFIMILHYDFTFKHYVLIMYRLMYYLTYYLTDYELIMNMVEIILILS